MNVARKLEKMGVRTSPMAEVFFENCEVPEENLLGKEGGGAFLFTRSMTWERGCILASAVGSMQRLLETLHPLCERAQTRRPVDRKIPISGEQNRGHESACRELSAHALPLRVVEWPP